MLFIKKYLDNQSGGMLPFFAVLIVGIIGMTALTIDQGRGLLVHRNSEDLADAVALASSAALDGTQQGWQNAKRMAVVAVSSARIHGVDTADLEAVDSFGNGVDVWESDQANFGSNVISVDGGKLVVTIQRGFYAYTGSDAFPQFTSLEGPEARHYHLPKFFIANAVRASVEVTDVATPIGNVVANLATNRSFEGFSSIGGQSTAVRHNELEFPVAPIAIPACEFLANMNVGAAARYHQDGFQPDGSDPINVVYGRSMLNQCQREVVAREPAAVDGDYAGNERRIDGNLRSESYTRPPLTVFEAGESALCYSNAVEGLHINCKAQPLNASLGAAGPGGAASSAINAGELAAALTQANAGTHMAKLGATFNPMGGNSFLGNAGVGNAINTLIAGGAPIRDVFYDGDDPAFNFPYRRNLVNTAEPGYSDPFAEMRITWTTEEAGDVREVAMLMGNSGDFHPTTQLNSASPGQHFRYTNPMCHTETAATAFDDKDNGRARSINIMLVASPDDPYCDLASEFGDSAPIDAVAPQSTTSPIIVGYVEANVFDYRIAQFDEQNWWLGGPDDPDPDDIGTDLPPANGLGNVLTDDNQFAFDSQFELPGLEGFLQDAETFADNQRDFLRCTSCQNHGFIPEEECDEWADVRDGVVAACPDEPEDLGDPPIPTWMEDCFGGATEVLDLLSTLDDLIPHSPPVADDGGGDGAPSGDSNIPACGEYCGGVREYGNLGSLSFEAGTVDSDCFDDMVANAAPEVCSEDPNWWFDEGGGEASVMGGGGGGSGTPIARPPIPDEECSVLCAPAPAGFRATCESYCESYKSNDPSSAFEEFLDVLEQLYERFREQLAERYGEDGPGDGGGPALPDEAIGAGAAGAGVNGAAAAPDLDLTDYIETNDGAREVCLPRRNNNCYDMTNPSCWEDPIPRQSGWGCGGIRMRLSCNQTDLTSLLAPRPFSELRPAIVSK